MLSLLWGNGLAVGKSFLTDLSERVHSIKNCDDYFFFQKVKNVPDSAAKEKISIAGLFYKKNMKFLLRSFIH